ncbi:MAG: YdcF family protein [Candidatus Micrarchaeota archaeon]|nr:YdcF family protein [Candidatus Micrarchaeota archaeon]
MRGVKSIVIGNGQSLGVDGPSQGTIGVANTVSEIMIEQGAQKAIFTGKRSFRINGLSQKELGNIPTYTEASAMRDQAVRRGVKDEDIYMELRALETVGNACFSKEIVRELGAERIFVVGPDHHIWRLALIYRWVMGEGYKIVPVTSPDDYRGEELRLMQKAEFASAVGMFHFWRKYGNSIKMGDDEEISRVLYATNKSYNENAQIDEEDQRMMDWVTSLRKPIRKYTTHPDLPLIRA